jgi:hypothetical protein
MSSLAEFFGSGFFFVPFLYFPFYLLIERGLRHHPIVQLALKTFTMLGGLFLIVYAITATPDFQVVMPALGGAKNYVSAPVFLVVAGAAIMTLPLYSKHLKLSNEGTR